MGRKNKSVKGRVGRRIRKGPPPISKDVCKTHKRPYRTDEHAKLELARLTLNDSKSSKVPGRTYKCEFCRWWHLTSRPLRTNARQTPKTQQEGW